MTILEAAYAVLAKAVNPLNSREIADRMIKDGWQTSSEKPWDTVRSSISVDIQKHGKQSGFVRTKRGHYAVNPDAAAGAAVPDAPPIAEPRPNEASGHDAPGRLSFVDAAEQILRESGDPEPLSYRSITQRALDQELIRTRSQAPALTMYAAIHGEIRRRQSRGETPRFVMRKGGLIELLASSPEGLEVMIKNKNAAVLESLLDRVRGAPPAAFEELVAALLGKLGFEDVEVTKQTRDGGIDVLGTLIVAKSVRVRVAVQAKRQKSNVQRPVVQQVRGSLGTHDQGLIITTSDFSRGAREEATRADATPVFLLNGEQLAVQLVEHEIGVRRETHDLFTLEEAESEE